MNRQNILETVVERTGGSRSALFLLQFVAWRKISMQGPCSGPHFDELAKHRNSRFKLYGLLSEISSLNEWFQIDENSLESLSQKQLALIIDTVQNCESLNFEYDELMGILSRGSWKHANHIFLPSDLVSLMINTVNLQSRDSVLCLYENSISLAFGAAEITSNVTVGDSGNDLLVNLFNILLDRNVKVGGKKPRPFMKEYDIVLYGGLREINDWVNQVVLTIEGLKGKAAMFVANTFLYRTAIDAFELKSDLIKDNDIDLVVSVPTDMIPFNAPECSIIVFDTDRTEDSVVFGDAAMWFKSRETNDQTRSIVRFASRLRAENPTDEGTVRISRARLLDSQCNIAPQRYLLNSIQQETTNLLGEAETKPLNDIVDIIRPRNFKEFVGKVGEEFFEISVSDIAEDGLVRPPTHGATLLDSRYKKRYPHVLLQQGDIIFPIKGSIGRIGMFRGHDFFTGGSPRNLLVNQSLIILRPREFNKRYSSVFLLKYLNSTIGRVCIESIQKGTSVLYLQIDDIKGIPIPVVPHETETQIYWWYDQILERFAEIEEIKTKIKVIESKIEKLILHKNKDP